MLAIVIPYYKHAYFEETLESLAGQTDKRFKVYIGDDASPEPPTALLEKYQGKFDLVYHRFENNLGGTLLTQQWDRCIGLIGNEEWIIILGDDDVLGVNVVANFYFSFNSFKGKSNLVRFATIVINEKTSKNSNEYQHPIWESVSDSFYRKIEGKNRSSLSEYVFSKKSFLKYGFYNNPIGWCSDDRAWFEFTNELPIFSINNAFVKIRISNLNISGKKDNIEIKNQAVYCFFRFIIKEKLYLFKKVQIIKILREYENTIKKIRTINIKDRIELLRLYMKYFEKKSFIEFIKRSLRTFFRK
ncbi:Glycosyl transferase family 2 [compost metagenome]